MRSMYLLHYHMNESEHCLTVKLYMGNTSYKISNLALATGHWQLAIWKLTFIL